MKLLVIKEWEKGLPWPYQSVNVQAPYDELKKKGAWKLAETKDMFQWKYPFPDKFIKIEDLEMDLDDVMKGVFIDINHQTEPGSINLKEKIISKGCGMYTEFV